MANKAAEWVFGRAAQIVVAAILAVASGAWEKFARVATWPEVIAIGLVTFVCLFWMADKFWRLPLRWQVRQWLDNTQYDVRTQSVPNCQFSFVLTDPLSIKTTIAQTKPDAPIFIAVMAMTPTAEQTATFNQWSQEKKDAFWRGVRMEFMRYGIEFSILKLDGDGVTLSTQIEASRDLTGLEFTRTVLHVRTGARLYLEHLLMIK